MIISMLIPIACSVSSSPRAYLVILSGYGNCIRKDNSIAILDISPVNKGHALVISKKCYPTFTDAPLETLSHMMAIARRIDAKQREVLGADGTNIMINNSPASGQEVPHLHIHVIPRYSGDGKTPVFSKEAYSGNEAEEYGEKLHL